MVAAMLEEETSVTSGVSGRFGDLDLREDGDVDGNRQKGRAGSEVRLGPSLSSKRRSWAVPQGPAMDEREGRAEQFGNAEDLSVPSAEKLRRRIFRLSLAAIEAHHRTISVQASRDLADGITGTPAYMAEGSALAASSLSAGILAGLAAPWKRHRNQHDEHAKEEASSLSPNEPYHVHHQYHQHSHHPHLNTSLLSQHPKAEASLSPTEPNHLCQQQQHHLPHSKTLLPDQHIEEYITSLIAAHDEELTLRRGEIFWELGDVEDYAGAVAHVVKFAWSERVRLIVEHEEHWKRLEEAEAVRTLAMEEARAQGQGPRCHQQGQGREKVRSPGRQRSLEAQNPLHRLLPPPQDPPTSP